MSLFSQEQLLSSSTNSLYSLVTCHNCYKNKRLHAILNVLKQWGPSWSWSYGSWVYNYLCNQCLSPLKFMARSTRYNFMTGRWLSPGTPVSSTNTTDCHGIADILLKVALYTTNQPTNLKNVTPTCLSVINKKSCEHLLHYNFEAYILF